MTTEILRSATSRARLASLAEVQFGDMVKAVVDVRRRVMAIGGELHSDEEAALIEDGSGQEDLWGINLYPAEPGDAWIEFDSMINVRPSQGNRSRSVEDEKLRDLIRQIVASLAAGSFSLCLEDGTNAARAMACCKAHGNCPDSSVARDCCTHERAQDAITQAAAVRSDAAAPVPVPTAVVLPVAVVHYVAAAVTPISTF